MNTLPAPDCCISLYDPCLSRRRPDASVAAVSTDSVRRRADLRGPVPGDGLVVPPDGLLHTLLPALGGHLRPQVSWRRSDVIRLPWRFLSVVCPDDIIPYGSVQWA